MTGFPWTTLITVAGPLAGALGAVELKGRQDDKERKQQAVRVDQSADADRRRRAYVDLLITAMLVLRNCRQLRVAYATGMFADPVAKEAFDTVGKLSEDMNRAVAVVQIVDTGQPRVCAEAIFKASGEVMDIFSRRSLALRGFGSTDEPMVFDIDAAESAIERLDDTIKAFVDSTHTKTAIF